MEDDPSPPPVEWTLTDAHAVHHAMVCTKAEAEERKEKMPSSVEAIGRHADQLRTIRDKILSFLPSYFRRNYMG